jgi:hypothetical protein
MSTLNDDGNYLIINVQHETIASLEESEDHTLVTAGTYTPAKQVESLTKNLIWSVTRLNNKRFQILNNEFGLLAFAGNSTEEHDNVKAFRRIQQWEIKATRNPNHFTIMTTDSALCWHLKDGEIGTAISLSSKTNQSPSHWRFQLISVEQAKSAPPSKRQPQIPDSVQAIPTESTGLHTQNPLSAVTWEGTVWQGSYAYYGMPVKDPPMFFTLMRRSGPPKLGVIIYFNGRGVDGVGPFNLDGEIFMNGLVEARKNYDNGIYWDWIGTVSPSGMSGTWGNRGDFAGWWWIWPQETEEEEKN